MTRTARQLTFLGLATAFLFACQSKEAKLTQHMERGDAYRKEEKFAEAIIEYRNVLQLDPNNATAHFGLAQSYLRTDQVRDGYWELRESVRLDPGNNEARLQFGSLARLAGEVEESLVQAEAVIAAEPTNSRAYGLKGEVLETLERFEEARAALEKSVELAPKEAAPIMRLAQFLVRRGEEKAAEPLLHRLTELEPGFAAQAALAGFLARDRGRDVEAEAAYRKALELAEPKQRILATQLFSNFYFSRDRFEETEKVLQAALQQEPKNLEYIYLLARFYAARGQQAEADAMIERATTAAPDEVRPQLVLSAYRSRQGDLEGALAAAEAALTINPKDVEARLRKAELLLDIGHRDGSADRIAAGRAIVDAVLAQQPDSPEGLFVRAKLDLAQGQADKAVEALRVAVERRPDWARAHFLLGSALFLVGDRNGARAELLRSLEIDADLIDARRVLARVYAAVGDLELSNEQVRRVLREQSENDELRVLLAQNLVRQGKPEEARAELESIPLARRDAEVLFALGRTAALQGQLEQALTWLREADAKAPGYPDILQTLLQLEARSGDLAKSVARLENAVGENPNNAQLVHLEGLAYLMSGKNAEGEELLRRAIDLDPNDLAIYQSLAGHLSRTGRREESLETYKKALAAKPDSPQLHFVLGTLYEADDPAQAMEHYESALRLQPDMAIAKNNLAYLMVEAGKDLDRALSLAQEAKAALPEHPGIADTLGWVLFKKGVPSAAVGYLKEAEAGFRPEDPSLAIVRHHLAQAYEANNEADKARDVLKRALETLDAQRKALSEQKQGELPPEPAWVAPIRAMLERLSS